MLCCNNAIDERNNITYAPTVNIGNAMSEVCPPFNNVTLRYQAVHPFNNAAFRLRWVLYRLCQRGGIGLVNNETRDKT